MEFDEYDPYQEVFKHADEGTLNTTILPDQGGPTIRHSTYKIVMGVIIAILFILAFVAIVLAIQYSSQAFVITLDPAVDRKAVNLKKIKPGFIKEQFTVDSHPGAISSKMVEAFQNGYRRPDDAKLLTTEADCLKENGTWDGKCTCHPFSWGERCERESYPNNYMMADHSDPSSLVVKETYYPDSLFGIGVGCTDLCDQDKDCHAINWDRTNKICRILAQAPDINGLSFKPEVDGNIFIRTDRGVGRPVVTKNVVLYSGKLKTRFWLDPINANEYFQILTINPDHLYRLSFYPSNCYNDNLMPLVYSGSNFTLRDAKTAIQAAKDGHDTGAFYVHLPGKNSFSPPLTMTLEPYYVMAVSQSQIDTIQPHVDNKSRSFKLISGSRSSTRSIKTRPIELESESSINSSMSYDQSLSNKMVSSNWSS